MEPKLLGSFLPLGYLSSHQRYYINIASAEGGGDAGGEAEGQPRGAVDGLGRGSEPRLVPLWQGCGGEWNLGFCDEWNPVQKELGTLTVLGEGGREGR